MFWLIVILGVVYLIYRWGTNTFDYFEKRGIAYNKPVFLVGSGLNVITQKLTLQDSIMKQYNEFPDEKITGGFEFKNPAFFIRDPHLLKELTVKYFDHFPDRHFLMNEEIDPLLGRAIFGLTGQKWRDMRATLSPAFTGTKMRQMLHLICQVGKQSVDTLKSKIDGKGEDFEMRDFVSKFTVDIMATTAFGIEVNSFENPNNEFQDVSKNVLNFESATFIWKIVGYFTVPKLMRFLKINVMTKKVCDFFQTAIIDVMNEREAKGIVRQDMINLLLEARRGKLEHGEGEKTLEGFATVEESDVGKLKVKRNWSDGELAAQAFLFFLAGYDTVTAAMALGFYELAVNPDIQDRLVEEIDELHETLDGNPLTYDHIQKMKYMDQFICEVLRRRPSFLIANRKCAKELTLDIDGKKVTFEKGVNFTIPFYAYHQDPKYFPDPEKFDPERFNEENRKKIDPATYLPFGIGPRGCIGSRMALMEIKTVFYYILKSFKVEVCEKTQIPLKYDKTPFQIRGEKGIWLKISPRID